MRYLLASIVFMIAVPGCADTQSVTLSVPGMSCPACPITVKRALTRVDGVIEVEVSFERREAVVTFDDDKTDVQALTRATENAGYPSSLAKGAAQ